MAEVWEEEETQHYTAANAASSTAIPVDYTQTMAVWSNWKKHTKQHCFDTKCAAFIKLTSVSSTHENCLRIFSTFLSKDFTSYLNKILASYLKQCLHLVTYSAVTSWHTRLTSRRRRTTVWARSAGSSCQCRWPSRAWRHYSACGWRAAARRTSSLPSSSASSALVSRRWWRNRRWRQVTIVNKQWSGLQERLLIKLSNQSIIYFNW